MFSCVFSNFVDAATAGAPVDDTRAAGLPPRRWQPQNLSFAVAFSLLLKSLASKPLRLLKLLLTQLVGGSRLLGDG